MNDEEARLQVDVEKASHRLAEALYGVPEGERAEMRYAIKEFAMAVGRKQAWRFRHPMESAR